MCTILQQDVQQLLEYFAKNYYRAKECEVGDLVLQRCAQLMRLDYDIVEIPNTNGDLSAHYPGTLLIPDRELKSDSDNNPHSTSAPPTRRRIDADDLRKKMTNARTARCRARFPVPVILYKGKKVCRSSTLSGSPEIYGRSSLRFINGDPPIEHEEDMEPVKVIIKSDVVEWPLCGYIRSKDIQLLEALGVETIIDFMVENKKMKFWVPVTSSEKADKENRYASFNVVVLPYPGCEFFREYFDSNCRAEGLFFNWNQPFVNADISIPHDPVTSQLDIEWSNYKQWDLLTITLNYLQLIIKYLQDGESGVLVHCISGWDRTPLFISLIRISLWADGAIHQSLDEMQLLYLTIGYDWYLFGHNLPNRLLKGEVILPFCFNMLKYITTEEFSTLTHRFHSQRSSESNSTDAGRTGGDCSRPESLGGESRGSSISLCSNGSGKSSSIYDLPTCITAGSGSHAGVASNSIPIERRNGSYRNGNASYETNFADEVLIYNASNGNFLSSSQDSNCSSIGIIREDSSNHNDQLSPVLPRRTSPVSVPREQNNRLRQRQESTSSIGSWQMVTGTGSFRSSESENEMHAKMQQCKHHPKNSLQNSHPPHDLNSSKDSNGVHVSTSNANQQHSCCTVRNGKCFPNYIDLYARRRERLKSLRTLFSNCYFSSIGYNQPNSTISNLLGNLAERVGLGNRPT